MRVLIADDRPIVRLDLREQLEREGIRRLRLGADVVARPDPGEVSEILWCPLAEVPLDEFAFESSIQAVRLLTARTAHDKPSSL